VCGRTHLSLIAPVTRGDLARRMAHFCNAGLGLAWHGTTFQRTGRAREAPMTRDQVVTWFILLAFVALIQGGAAWLSRGTP
jgi:hypothetical protein